MIVTDEKIPYDPTANAASGRTPEEGFNRMLELWHQQVELSRKGRAEKCEPAYSYRQACVAAEDYLISLGIHYTSEVGAHTRLTLALALKEELPTLDALDTRRRAAARTELFESCGLTMGSFNYDPAAYPSTIEVVEHMKLIGCRDKNAQSAFKNIIARFEQDCAKPSQ